MLQQLLCVLGEDEGERDVVCKTRPPRPVGLRHFCQRRLVVERVPSRQVVVLLPAPHRLDVLGGERRSPGDGPVAAAAENVPVSCQTSSDAL
eukprot:752157-Hanusia_phi.AAC.3